MTRTSIFIMMGLMLTGIHTHGQGYYRVDLEPDTAKRRAIPIEFGSYSADLHLYSAAPWRIGGSRIVAPPDDCLWTGPYVQNASEHLYRMVGGYSSREYVAVYGDLVRDGSGPAGARGSAPPSRPWTSTGKVTRRRRTKRERTPARFTAPSRRT